MFTALLMMVRHECVVMQCKPCEYSNAVRMSSVAIPGVTAFSACYEALTQQNGKFAEMTPEWSFQTRPS